MLEARGLPEVIAQATQQNPAMRMVTAGHAVQAMGRHGRGFLNPQRFLVPQVCPNQPLSRLMAPGLPARPLPDDPLGRALDTLYAYGVTALYRRIAATAATRLGLPPPCSHRETPRFHVDGRSTSAEAPAAQVVPIPHGSRRHQRPDRNQGRLAWIVEHPAGSPLLMPPLRGHRSAGNVFGQGVRAPMAQLQTLARPPSLGAASALSNADHLHQLAATRRQWLPRVPATVPEAQQG